MKKEEIAPHVEEITRVLEGEVEEQEIWKEFEDYINLYKVDLETAKRGIVRKYGGDPGMLTQGVRKTIDSLRTTDGSVDLLVRVVTVNERTIDKKDGTQKKINYGIFGDETGTVPFTVWEPDRFDFQKGEVYQIQNAYVKEFQDKPQINLNERSVATKEDQDALPMPEGYSSAPAGEVGLSQLQEGMSSVTVTVRILSLEEREVNAKGETKTIWSGVVADETAKSQFTSWTDLGLKEGEVVKIQNAYVKSWRGIPQLNVNERSEVTRPDIDFPSTEELSPSRVRKIADLERVGGGVDVAVKGVVVDIKRGSGLIFRCPECNRQVQSNTCRVHGKVEGQPDLRIKAVVDDGTGTLTGIINREVTEALLGIELDSALQRAREAMDHEIIKEEMEEKMLAYLLWVQGNVISDDFGLMMIVNEARFPKEDVTGDARELLAKLEA
ncbi:MAG: hypothetical protein ACOCSO_03405 [Thermoplasmatota archaeon]